MIANPVPWPNGARCAVAFTFDMDADSILHLAHHTSADTRLAAMSMLRYGPEIAVPRLVELYKRFGMHQTFFLPAWCMERYPAAVEAILQGGHEIAHHGYLHEHPNELPSEEELYWLQRGIDVFVSHDWGAPAGLPRPNLQILTQHPDPSGQREFRVRRFVDGRRCAVSARKYHRASGGVAKPLCSR